MLQLEALSLYFEESGEGTPVLLLHGLGSTGRDWESVAPRLAARYRVIVPDARGAWPQREAAGRVWRAALRAGHRRPV